MTIPVVDKAEKALLALQPDHFSFSVKDLRGEVVRYANNVVTQSSSVANLQLIVRIWAGGGVADITLQGAGLEDLDNQLRHTMQRAVAVGRTGLGEDTPPDASTEATDLATDYSDPEILECLRSPGYITDGLVPFFARAQSDRVELAGRLEHRSTKLFLVNSKGLRKDFSQTCAEAQVIAVDEHDDYISGYSAGIGHRRSHLALTELADRAVQKCVRARTYVEVDKGAYDVILEPEAVTEVLDWLGSIGLTGKSLEDRSSFMTGRVGETVMSPNITLSDDALCDHGLGLPQPFDLEGTPKQRVVFVENGVAKGVAWDRNTARRAGCQSTGHANNGDFAGNTGPTVNHLVLDGGNHTEQDLLDRVERGLWITRFHYVNGLLDPPKGMMTGLTRDGTFLIENGTLGPSVGMLRFTDSMIEAFQRVDALTREQRAVRTGWSVPSAAIVPTVLIRGLQFTGNARG
ncbi:MAG: hypothetical protein CMH54_15725 [Myxococcales bacterium]|nr:hypothetical protein [Myxococcales bacterium]